MKAIKFLLLSALAFGLVFGWMQWLGRLPDSRPSVHEVANQASPHILTPEPLHYTYNEVPPKLDAPDKIAATIEPDDSSTPFANADSQLRRAVGLGARVLKDPTAIEDSIEFRAPEPKKRSDWQTPPRLNLKPGGLSTPFSKPDWDEHPPLNRILDGRPIPKPGSGL